MLPRAAKLPDAGDKGGGPGGEAARGWQTVTLRSHSSARVVQSLSPTLSSPLSLQPKTTTTATTATQGLKP